MNKLVLIRHGEFDPGSIHLNTRGRTEIEKLIPSLKKLQDPIIFSSLGPRSQESALIIASELGVSGESKEIFGTNNKQNQAKYYSQAIEFLKDLDKDVIIVSKGEYLDGFAEYAGEKLFGLELNPIALKRGEGVILSKNGCEILAS